MGSQAQVTPVRWVRHVAGEGSDPPGSGGTFVAAMRILGNGTGPVSLFIHGTASSGRIWLKMLEGLDVGTSLLLDLPGMGDSDSVPSLSVADWLSCVRQVGMSFLQGSGRPSGIGVRLVGHSLGGALATLLAGETWVESVALVAPGTPEFGRDLLRRLGPGSRPGTIALDKVGGPLAFDRRRLTREDAIMLRDDFEKARPLLASGLPWPVSEDANDPGDFYDQAGLAKPFLVVWGEEDRVVAPAYVINSADYLRSKGVNVTRVPIPRCGHVPMLEYPCEVARAIGDFWNL